MAAPVYFQTEVDALLAMPKLVVFESFRRPTRKEKKRRHNAFEEVAVIAVTPDPPVSGVGFEMDVCHNLRTDHIAITLYATIHPRPLLPICRYDVQDLPHQNRPPCDDVLIEAGQFHRHVYSEAAIFAGEPDDWCACAEPIEVAPGGTPQTQLARLKKKFIDDMRITFEERDTRNLLIDFGP